MMGGRQRKVSRRIFVGRGAIFREAITQENPLQVVGTINAYSAMLAKATGFRAIYLSGAGVANASFGLPDLGITTLSDVVTDASRINAAVDLPMLVDIDTGFGSAFSITRTIQEMERAGVAAVHIEDQVQAKRCGHRPGKELVSADEMVDRVKASVDARRDESFVIMARTDAHAVEGIESALDRACRYVEAGADMIFAEALADRSEYLRFTQAVKVPVLANLTEFGKTPLYTLDDLRQVGVRLALYPLSAFRAMSLAALRVFDEIRRAGTQQGVVNQMQTREDLYRVLDYHAYEEKLDQLFARGNHG
jgi:methylisocitrate lyase